LTWKNSEKWSRLDFKPKRKGKKSHSTGGRGISLSSFQGYSPTLVFKQIPLENNIVTLDATIKTLSFNSYTVAAGGQQ
jgi:hypothetical protein